MRRCVLLCVRHVEGGETRGGGMLGFETNRLRDTFPTRSKGSPDQQVARFIGDLNTRGIEMGIAHGWEPEPGARLPEMVQNAHMQVGDPSVIEEGGVTDEWRISYGERMANHAAEEGLGLWREQKRGEIDARELQKTRRLPKTFERTDLPSWMHWTVPPKRVRLEHWFQEKARQLKKTPEFDLSPFQRRMLDKMWNGLEKAIMHNPLPFAGSRENFAVTHIECLRWNSLELWLVCWKLVLDESEKARYESILRGSIVSRWGMHVREHWGKVGSKMLTPVFHFTYDDGTIPYKPTLMEENIMRASKGLAPKPMNNVPREQWAMNVTKDDIDGTDMVNKVDYSLTLRGEESVFAKADDLGFTPNVTRKDAQKLR
eukprot:Hpha_TRINITY_DN23628_c0_g1::TRINITY_DN23628_c0_g1_i1::g.57609::m.57609